MHILIVNPNTTASMTEKIGSVARACASPGTTITAVNPTMGPASIEGPYDEAFSVPGMLAEIARGEAEGVDAHIIACFDDTGLEAARSLARAPVIGIGEAGYHVASLVAHRFSVVTTLARSIPVLEANLVKYGLMTRCGRVRASGVAVLELEDPRSGARESIETEIKKARAEEGAEAIVLGCAGMAGLADDMSRRAGIPVIDCVAAAVRLAETVVALGLRTSKVGAYAAPLPKAYTGVFAGFAPPPIAPAK